MGSLKQRIYLDKVRRLNRVCEYLYAYDKRINETPGIYVFTRINPPTKDGTQRKYAYIGQAKSLVDRVAQHLLSFAQRIDISLKTRGLWYPSNPYGWKIDVYYCNEDELDQKEREFIKAAQEQGYELYNITSGGQDEGKEDINQRQAGKCYRDGVAYGYGKAIKDIKEFFDKYLDYNIKNLPEVFRKPKNKAERESNLPLYKEIYIKKQNEFKELLENGKKGTEDNNTMDQESN